jgi:hypothetical protein
LPVAGAGDFTTKADVIGRPQRPADAGSNILSKIALGPRAMVVLRFQGTGIKIGSRMSDSFDKSTIDEISKNGVVPEKRTEYMKLLEIHNFNRVDYNTRKWETLKYFQSIVLAFLDGTVVAFTTGIDKGLFCKSLVLSAGFTGILSALPIVASIAAALGVANLRRESALLFAEEAQMFKIAKLLELDLEVQEGQRWLAGDQYLLMPKWRDWRHGLARLPPKPGFDDWVQLRTGRHRFKNLSDALFRFEMVLAVLSLMLVWLVFADSQFNVLAGTGPNACVPALLNNPSDRYGMVDRDLAPLDATTRQRRTA